MRNRGILFFSIFFLMAGLFGPRSAKAGAYAWTPPALADHILWNAGELKRQLSLFNVENRHLFNTGIIPDTIIRRGWVGPPQTTYFAIRYFEAFRWVPGTPLLPGVPDRQMWEVVRPAHNMVLAAQQLQRLSRTIGVGIQPVPGGIGHPHFRGRRGPIGPVGPIPRPVPYGPNGIHPAHVGPNGFHRGAPIHGGIGAPIGAAPVVANGFGQIFHFQLEANLRNAYATVSLINESLQRLYYAGGHPFIYNPIAADLLRYRLWMIQRHLNNLRYLVDVAQHLSGLHAHGVGVVGDCFAHQFPAFQFQLGAGVNINFDFIQLHPNVVNGNFPQIGAIDHAGHVESYEYSTQTQYRQPVIQGNLPQTHQAAPGVAVEQYNGQQQFDPPLSSGQQQHVQDVIQQQQGQLQVPRGQVQGQGRRVEYGTQVQQYGQQPQYTNPGNIRGQNVPQQQGQLPYVDPRQTQTGNGGQQQGYGQDQSQYQGQTQYQGQGQGQDPNAGAYQQPNVSPGAEGNRAESLPPIPAPPSS